MIWIDFGTLSPSKAKAGTAKANAFWRFLARQVMGCIFCHCDTGVHIFPCSFWGDFRCILVSVCMILDARLEAWSRSTNGLLSMSKRVIFITSCSVFDTSKIELKPTFCEFWCFVSKTMKRKCNAIMVIYTQGSGFSVFLHISQKPSFRRRKEVNGKTFCKFASTPKSSKNACTGVPMGLGQGAQEGRNQGNWAILFFHIV